MTALQIFKIVDELRNNQIENLSVVDLGPMYLGDDGFERTLQALSINTSLKKLDIMSPSHERLGKFVTIFATNTPTKLLHLKISLPDADSANILNKLFKTNTTIKLLDLTASTLGDAGLISIITALQESGNTTLRGVDFSVCNIGDIGAMALVEYFASPTCKLKYVNLSANWLSYAAEQKLSAAARQHNIELNTNRGLFIGPMVAIKEFSAATAGAAYTSMWNLFRGQTTNANKPIAQPLLSKANSFHIS